LLSENVLKFLLLIRLTWFLLIIKSSNGKTPSWLFLFQSRLWLVGVNRLLRWWNRLWREIIKLLNILLLR
jgi:hypothetical protein